MNKELKYMICGSYRRGQSNSGDIDVLVTHPKLKEEQDIKENAKYILIEIVMKLTKVRFLVDHLTVGGETKYMGMCKIPQSDYARRIDIRFVPFNSFSAATLYFTGSKNLNQIMRELAIKKGYKLNEYGLYKTEFNKSLNKR